MENKGFIQVYTGNGKGKTTAALGLALRAYGAGKQIYIGQFIKGKPYSELDSIRLYLPKIVVKQYGLNCFIENDPKEEDIVAAQIGLDEMKNIIDSGKYDLVIMDELNIALYYKLIDINKVLEILKNKPEHVEIVITGRYVHEKIAEIADLVTEMHEFKHYYHKGVEARIGIEM